MLKTKRHALIAAVITFIIATICLVSLFTANVAYAEDIEKLDNFNFTLLTNADGEQSYSVSIKATAKPTVEVAIIPETYNNLPVTEVANNGFMSCAKLKKVVLPTTIKKIGNNAFMNCAKLERIALPSIESIGMNAFAMCPLLDRVYIPNSVQTVGANILRNNANTVFIQSSAEYVGAEWQSTWNSYFTGDVIYGIEPEDTVGYREILDEQGSNVIGYEISEYQFITSEETDIVIYNSFRPNEDSEYLPVLNICSEAFTLTQVNSITIKDRYTEDSGLPKFTHKINIRSNAFMAFLGNQVSIEVDITFDHPEGLQINYNAFLDNSEITGDVNGNSTKIFEESTISSVTLPSNIEFLPERMFYNCPYLQHIKYSGEDYDGTNILTNISKIGAYAFASCIGLSNITVPSSVIEVGESAFYAWGGAESTQTINIEFYEGFIPDGWSSNWFDGNLQKTTLIYKALTNVTIDMQDDEGTELVIGVKPNLEMPVLDKPTRKGYIFKGIYSERDGGFQYYTNEMAINKLWTENEPTTLYAHWQIEVYDIIYPDEIAGIPNPNPTTYTVKDIITIVPIEYQGYIYTFIPNSINKGSTGNITLAFKKDPKEYNINYVVDLKGNINNNPLMYNVTQEIVFENLASEGYTFSWSPSTIPIGSNGDIEVHGIWTPNVYNINYVTLGATVNNNPTTFTYGTEVRLVAPVRGGYFAEWNQSVIPAGTAQDVTITAIYTEKLLDQCYNNGVYEIWTKNQFESLRNQPNGGSGRTYRLMDNILGGTTYNVPEIEPITVFNGTLDGNEHEIYNYALVTTSGGNLGLFRVNNGTIKNLKIAIRFAVGDTLSNVNVGVIAGVNKGSIINCAITDRYSAQSLRCFAMGDSFMGCFVGSNEGTIESCYGGDALYGTCNMGTVAGKNLGIIKNCNVGTNGLSTWYTYSDYNASVGGIVGLQTAGSIANCSFKGRIYWTSNYWSESEYSMDENREMEPCIGIMVGWLKGGTISGSSWQPNYGETKIVVSASEPKVVTWETGALWWKKTHTHDQGRFFKNEECGYRGAEKPKED